MEEFYRQKKILEAKAKAQAREDFRSQVSQKPKRPSSIADLYLRLEGYLPPLPPKETTDSPPETTSRRQVTSLLFKPHHRLLPYSDEAPDWNPGGKKVHPMLRHRVNPYPDAKRKTQRVKASSSVPKATEAQPSAPKIRSVASVAVQTTQTQPSTSVTNEVNVEAVRVQPSTSVPNDVISEVTHTQIPVPVSNNMIVEEMNAQPSPPSSKDASMESGRHTSPMSVDVSVESGRHTSPMSVDVSMESAENVLLSPSTSMGAPPPRIQNDCFSVASGPLSTSGASSLRVGRVKSSRNHIPRPYTIRSSARSLAEGDGFMPDRDKEIAMLEEAAKNVPLFNLPANFSFTENVGHSTTSTFFFTNNCSQKQHTEHDATAAKASYTESLPHSTPGVPPAQEMQSTVSSVPNFFASSAAFQPLEIKTPSSMFGAQGSTTLVSNPAPLHAASSISSPGVPFNGTPSANLIAKGHVNPPLPSFPTEDAANPLWDGDKKTENAQRDQNLSLGQQAYAPAASMSYGGRSSV